MATLDDLDVLLHKQGLTSLFNAKEKQTSDPTSEYNCIAHAFGDSENWWWPNGLSHAGHDLNARYWPTASANMNVIDAFFDWFQKDGWEKTDSDAYEIGITKIALYADDRGTPTHAARQIGENEWTSKLGQDLDLTHALIDLIGDAYGKPMAIFKKAK